MAPIPDQNIEKTLSAIDVALENRKALEAPRNYLGMSEIGEPCWRKLFYSFRNAGRKRYSSSGVKTTEDGYMQEDLMAFRLRMLPYIELHTTASGAIKNEIGSRIIRKEEDYDQIGFSLLLGHFCGHCDGVIRGILEAPGTWHVWEHKSVNIEKSEKLKKLKREKGEKKALEAWDIIYFLQAQIYMHELKMTRHYLTVTTPGGRSCISVRTEYNRSIAEDLITKAKVIIFDNWSIPDRMKDDPEYYLCRWCEFNNICHSGEFPLVHCKTCRYSEPVLDGKRKCILKDIIVPNAELYKECGDHVFNPALINATLIEHQQDGCLYYVKEKDCYFANTSLTGFPDTGKRVDVIHTSYDLKYKIKSIQNISKEVSTVQKTFNGTVDEFSKETNPAFENGKLVSGLEDL